MTLIEMLVVVALVGLVAGAVALGIGSLGRASDPRAEAELLAVRMRRASEEALLTGRPVALSWTERDYGFLTPSDGTWTPHPVPLLGERRTLPPGMSLSGEADGEFVVTAADLPEAGAPLRLLLGRDGAAPSAAIGVLWDGATVALLEPSP